MEGTPLWAPSPEAVERANLTRFREFLERRGIEVGPGYCDLWAWSVADQNGFWGAFWDFAGVVGERGDIALEEPASMPGARYFPAARLNFAENLLVRRDEGVAIIAANERGDSRKLTWSDLYDLAGRVAVSLLEIGIQPGDRVAALVPNVPEAVAFMLGAGAVGAVVSTASPGFGVSAVLDRFAPLEPRVLLGSAGHVYAGRSHDTRHRLAEISEQIPSLERLVVLPGPVEGIGPTTAEAVPTMGKVEPSRPLAVVAWSDFLAPAAPAEIPFRRLPFDHPLYILFSSGTTGRPKCMVHAAGGILLQHLKEHRLHCDVRPGDRVFYFTTCGWMMWNWLASALASEATLVLYDGSPFHPDGDILFDLAERTHLTHFGTSAKYVDTCRKTGLDPRHSHDLSRVRAVLSTGSPLSEEGFRYVYEHVSDRVHLASVSGGTDICACFVGGVPTEPVRAGEIQGPALATAVEVFDEDGRPLVAGKGELVCTAPLPSMPIGFHDDPTGASYRAAYFERFPGSWHHGDFAERTPSGGFVIHGRSDATLNAGGVRIGTAEIYRPVERLEAVAEAIAVAQEWEGDSRVVLFVRLASGRTMDDALEEDIRTAIRIGASPRHVPAIIVPVDDIPRTRSGKIVEIAVREAVHGRPVPNLDALANPEALTQFMDRAELAPGSGLEPPDATTGPPRPGGEDRAGTA